MCWAVLADLEELADGEVVDPAERDGAILRLVYTFEAIWKAAALLLEQQDGIAVGSPKSTVRAARRVGLLGDQDAEDALRIAEDRTLTVHMYKQGRRRSDRRAPRCPRPSTTPLARGAAAAGDHRRVTSSPFAESG